MGGREQIEGGDSKSVPGADNATDGPSPAAGQPDGKGKSSSIKKVASYALAIIIIVLVFAFAIPSFADYGDIFRIIGDLGTAQVLLLLVASLATMVLAWTMYEASLPGIGFWQSSQIMLSQNLIASTLPAGAPISLGVAYAIIHSYGFGAADLTLMLGVSGIWNTFAKLALPMVSALILVAAGRSSARMWALALIGLGVLLAAVAVLVLIFWKRSVAQRLGDLGGRAASWFLRFFHRGTVTTWGDAVVRFRDQTVRVARHRWVILSILAISYQMATFVVFLLSIRFVGVSTSSVSTASAFVVFAFVRLISAIPITPGAMGIAEVSYTAFLVTAGASRPEAAAGVLLFRGLTHLMPLPFGVIAYLSWIIKRGRKSTGQACAPQENKVSEYG